MKLRLKPYTIITAVTIGLILLPILAPAFRGTDYIQLKTALLPDENPWNLKGLNKIAAKYPNDLDLQIAACNSSFTFGAHQGNNKNWKQFRSIRLRNIENLIARFPNQPAAYANAMGDMTQLGVRVGREQDQNLPSSDNEPSLFPTPPSPHLNPTLLEKFDRYGAEAEKLDPNNAFFPYMRSIALFGLHRDSEAIREIIRAGKLPFWNDYNRSEMRGYLKLMDIKAGGKAPLLRVIALAFIIYPDFDEMDSSVRLAIHDAITAERSGNRQKGFEIRKALRRYGGLMRADSKSVQGNLEGMAIAGMASRAPGGNLPPAPPGKASPKKRFKRDLDFYLSYLKRIKHPEEAKAYQKEVKAGLKIRQIINSGVEHLYGVSEGDEIEWIAYQYMWIIFLYGESILLLQNGIFVLCIGLICSLILILVSKSDDALRKYKIYLGFLIFMAVFIVMEIGLQDQLSMFEGVYHRLVHDLGIVGQPHAMWLIWNWSALIPAFAVLLAIFINYMNNKPFMEGVVRRMKTIAVPLAFTLILIWSFLFLGVIHTDAILNKRTEIIAMGEGQGYARMLHLQWPGVIR